uniref:Ig-like domain-containing protein n=1 Tax=Cyprinus carpio TaxID=7962 RepID=A0A8C1NSA5_CYPCA
MNVFQESCCSILGVLLVFLLQGSCSDPDAEVVHKAVGESLELIADYPKDGLEVQWTYNENVFAEFDKYIKPVGSQSFLKRLKMNEDNISVTVEDLKRQDSGSFSMVARAGAVQHKTKIIELHVHELIRDVQIEYNVSRLQSENICTFHLRCLASGDPNPSYSWSGHQIQTQGPHLNISLRPAENATLTCTANNTYSVNYTTETVVCREKLDYSSVLSGIVLHLNSLTIKKCYMQEIYSYTAVFTLAGQGESEAGITVYEEVNTDGPAKVSASICLLFKVHVILQKDF